ncbi:hypothetical protein BG015_000892 [Linnemannia schmuckeri]|uniref:NAD(P)-binding domain-containing protein n=1 Tax=Linnemannia schmuckeri TaxID=64567 RepID=A0A9P5RSL5_9FUNG|nr:hypothetical protein BG015_000892 [Linnemannia schmuckeri]
MSTTGTPAFTGKTIAFTNANSWVGCSAALHLSQGLQKYSKDVQLVCLVRDDENLDLLKQLKNVRVEKVDYENEATLEKALHGVSCTVLFMEMDEQRVLFGKNLVAAMKKAHINSCLMVSIRGAGSSRLRSHQAYHEVEQEIKKNISNYVILRKAILSQAFLFWSHIVEERSRFPMAMSQDALLTHVDLIDVVGVIEAVTIEHCRATSQCPNSNVNSFGKYTNKIYTLAGSEQTHPRGIVQILNASSGNNVEFKEVSREELAQYFRSLTKHDGWEKVDADQCNKLLNWHGGPRHQYAPSLPMIDLLLDEYEWCSIDNTLVPDMQEILGREGKTLRDFFLKEKEAFKPHRAYRATAKL